jgi:hypothetical protein
MNDTDSPTPDASALVGTSDLLADLKRTLDAAVREYDTALMRKPTNEEEIRRAVDKCVYARERFNAALANTKISNAPERRKETNE